MHVHVTPRAELPITRADGPAWRSVRHSLGGYVLRRTPLRRRSVRHLLRRSCRAGCRAACRAAGRDAVVDRRREQPHDPDGRRVQRPVRELAGRPREHHPGAEHRRGLRRAAEGGARGRRAGAPLPPRPRPPPPRPRRRSAAPAPMGGYTVRPGDTLSGLAAGARVSVSAIAAMNGLDPTGHPSRRHRHQASDRRARPGPRRAAGAGRDGGPAGRARADRQRASAPPTCSPSPPPHGVSPSLATAIAWQESGFNNSMVSCANARGVMQVMPGTWDYVQRTSPRASSTRTRRTTT